MSALVIASYLGLITLLDRALGGDRTAVESAIIVLVLAVIFNPVRIWLQRRVDRLFYGSRQDPVRALAEVGSRLGTDSSGGIGLEGALAALCDTLRFPAAAIRVNATVLASVGEPSNEPYVAPLRRGTTEVGELLVGPRIGERSCSKPISALLHCSPIFSRSPYRLPSWLTSWSSPRADLITAREEERQRLRRDLHDGLGPALTGVMLKAAAARRLAITEPTKSVDLLRDLERNVAAAIADVRGLVDELRPPVLDGRGLVGALQDYMDTVQTPSSPRLQLSTDGVAGLEHLPESVEVAAYRIVTESLTNVLRHAQADSASVTLCAGRRSVTHEDHRQWHGAGTVDPGVGLSSMRERRPHSAAGSALDPLRAAVRSWWHSPLVAS